MTSLDPATGRPLPDSAIQRVTFATDNVHVYQIPPLTSTKGFNASSWTAPPRPTAQQIFTARVRIIETSVGEKLKADIVLEDGKTGDLFAAAPYTGTAVVQQAQDSSRFFAVRVQGEGGMKATLGIGFEDRSPAFDFSIALEETRKVLAMENGGMVTQGRRGQQKLEAESKKDFSLKEGQSIHIDVHKGDRRWGSSGSETASAQDDGSALFSIAPPPSAGKVHSESFPIAAPPTANGKTAQELGFDDGEFGEFQ